MDIVDKIAAHVFFEGRVQGVGFRWFVKDEADRLGLCGWVRNLPDGEVEAWIEGWRDANEALLKAVKRGNGHCRVDETRVEWLEPRMENPDFRITL